jgi:dethiobiotin synthetase
MRIVIVGTGTEIGKTHLGVTLVSAASRRGWSVCGLKPVESGVPEGQPGEDAAALSAAGSFHVKHPQPYALLDAVSPHLAARRAGVTIELDRVLRWVDDHAAPWVIVETAGALLSPLGNGLTNLDLAVALRPDVWILVGVDRLGVLHDITACRWALGRHPVPAPVVVLQAPRVPDTSTGTNAAELRDLGIAGDVFTMPRGAPLSEACQSAASAILDRLAAKSPA